MLIIVQYFYNVNGRYLENGGHLEFAYVTNILINKWFDAKIIHICQEDLFILYGRYLEATGLTSAYYNNIWCKDNLNRSTRPMLIYAGYGIYMLWKGAILKMVAILNLHIWIATTWSDTEIIQIGPQNQLLSWFVGFIGCKWTPSWKWWPFWIYIFE